MRAAGLCFQKLTLAATSAEELPELVLFSLAAITHKVAATVQRFDDETTSRGSQLTN